MSSITTMIQSFMMQEAIQQDGFKNKRQEVVDEYYKIVIH